MVVFITRAGTPSPERLAPRPKRRKMVIEDEEEDEGPAPSLGEPHSSPRSRRDPYPDTSLRGTIGAELEPCRRSYVVLAAAATGESPGG